jgi:PAS domain S-box-containing protein
MQENIQVENRKKDLYKILFDIVFEAVIIIDLDTYNIIDANSKALKMFEYSFDELSHLKITVLSTDTEQTEKNLANENLNYITNIWYKRKGDIKFPVEISIGRLIYENKKIIVFNIKDLTENFQKKKMEEELLISEKRYKAIVEDQIELICRFTPDGLLTFVNKACCDYFGKSYEELIGTSFIELIGTINKEFVDNLFKKINKDVPHDHCDFKFIKDGQAKWIHWSNRAIFDDCEKIIEYQSIGFDITERKCLEEKVRESRNRYRAILDNLQDGFYQTDKDGNVIFISHSALEILGYINQDEILGQPIKNYFLKPDNRDILVSCLKRAGGKLYDYEVEVLNKNGDVILISLNIQIILDDNGEYNGSQGTFRDVTEFKRRMNEIIKLYHIVEGSQNALVLVELDGTIVYANNASLTIARSPEWVTTEGYVLGKKIKNFISFDDSLTFGEICEIINKNGKWFGSAYAFCACNNKERIPIDVMFSKIQNGGGKYYIVASYYDVSEYRRLEEKIKEQSRMYEELTEIMQDLVEQMNSVNARSFEKITHLEEAFRKSVNNFMISSSPQKGGYRVNAS